MSNNSLLLKDSEFIVMLKITYSVYYNFTVISVSNLIAFLNTYLTYGGWRAHKTKCSHFRASFRIIGAF